MKKITNTIFILLISSTVINGNSHELEICIHVGHEPYKEYSVKGNKIEFVHGIVINNKIISRYSRELSPEEMKSLIKFIEKCDLGKLERRYINRNIEDGYSASYNIKVKGTEIKIFTANVYHPTLISICEKLNDLLPGVYHMYIPSKTDPGMISFDQIKDTQ